MNGRRRKKAARSGAARGRADGAMLPHDQNALVDDRLGARDRPISKNARSRAFVDARLDSATAYAEFAAAAGRDIFDGESLDRFREVNKFDESALRFKAHELREKVVALTFHARAGRQPEAVTA